MLRGRQKQKGRDPALIWYLLLATLTLVLQTLRRVSVVDPLIGVLREHAIVRFCNGYNCSRRSI